MTIAVKVPYKFTTSSLCSICDNIFQQIKDYSVYFFLFSSNNNGLTIIRNCTLIMSFINRFKDADKNCSNKNSTDVNRKEIYSAKSINRKRNESITNYTNNGC